MNKAKVPAKPAGQVSYGKPSVARTAPPPTLSRVQNEQLKRAIALHAERRYAELEQLGHDWVKRFPKQAGKGWGFIGLALIDLNRFDEAEAALRRAAALDPTDVDVWDRLGVVLNRTGRFADAHEVNMKAVALAPRLSHVLNNTAANLVDAGRYDEGLEVIDTLLKINPKDRLALLTRGNAFLGQGRLDDSIAAYEYVTELMPDWPDGWNNLGGAYNKRRYTDKAIAAFERALSLNPDQAESWSNLGVILMDRKREQDALDCFNRAVDLKPNMASGYLNLGSLLQQTGRPITALDYLERARTINPVDPMIYMGLGACYRDLGRFDEAVVSYVTALELKPDFTGAFGNLLFALNYHPTLSAEEIFKVYQQFEEINALVPPGTWEAHANVRDPQKRLKIGYVSPDYQAHPVQNFLEPLLASHDRERFELFAYADLAAPDATTDRYRTYFDHWLTVNTFNDRELAARIRADGIDILVDLAGHTSGNRLQAFSLKPAPVQVSWLGYGGTTGISAIDYLLGEAVMMPAGCERLLAEKPWRLPRTGFVYRPSATFPAPFESPAAANGYVTFGTLSRAVRLNDDLVAVWAELLRRVPTSHLVINSRDFRTSELQDWMLNKFTALGIDPARLNIEYDTPAWVPMMNIDIMLDCFPHNSGTTLIEGLYSGIPVVSLAHRPTVGTLGGSLVNSVGHPEWIARDVDEYLQIAADLASDIPRLAHIRSTLRDDMKQSPLMDEAAFCRNVEQAYREMWQIHCNQQ